jgi:hypothetical protein
MNLRKLWTRPARTPLRVTTMLSMLTLTLLLTGCATRIKVVEISSDRAVVTVHAGVPFTPPCDGKFVPEARFKEMLDATIRDSFKR